MLALLAALLVLPLALAPRAEAFIYWDITARNGRANLDGTGVDCDSWTSRGVLAVDARHIYWGRQDGDTVARAKLDGTGIDEDTSRGCLPRFAVGSAPATCRT